MSGVTKNITKSVEIVYDITLIDEQGAVTRDQVRVPEGSELEKQMDAEIERLAAESREVEEAEEEEND